MLPCLLPFRVHAIPDSFTSEMTIEHRPLLSLYPHGPVVPPHLCWNVKVPSPSLNLYSTLQ